MAQSKKPQEGPPEAPGEPPAGSTAPVDAEPLEAAEGQIDREGPPLCEVTRETLEWPVDREAVLKYMAGADPEATRSLKADLWSELDLEAEIKEIDYHLHLTHEAKNRLVAGPRDKLEKLRWKLAGITPPKAVKPKLTGAQRLEISRKLKTGASVKSLAREYDVSRRTIDTCKPGKAVSIGTVWKAPTKK